MKQYFFLFLQIRKTANPLKNNPKYCVKRSKIRHRLIQKDYSQNNLVRNLLTALLSERIIWEQKNIE